jgi:hypothetical protein
MTEAERGKRKRRKQKAQAVLRALKGTYCPRCKREHPPERLHWHHRPGEVKSFNPGRLNEGCATRSLHRLLLEVAKCEVLCVSCHAKQTPRDEHGRFAASVYTVEGGSA